MLSVKSSLNLAGTNLLEVLSPAHDFLPYFTMKFDREKKAECQMVWPSHNVGRWWDALLRLEAVTGFKIPDLLEEKMLVNIRRCLDNPLMVCGHVIPRDLSEIGIDPVGWFDDHSQREALLALTALVRYRKLDWAGDLGSRMVRALDRYIQADGFWDYDLMKEIASQGGVSVSSSLIDFYRKGTGFRMVETTGRLIEALLEFYLATEDAVALSLADRLARFHLETSTRPDGSNPPGEHIHTHSYLGTLRGLLMFGELTGQHEYVDRVELTYRKTILKVAKKTGFISHDFTTEKDGETGSAGDIVQLGLRLARNGYPEYFDDAERVLRARLLPSQIVQSLGLRPTLEDGKDEHLKLNERALGAFGGMYLHSHGGPIPTTDITAADIQGLCEIYTHIAEKTVLGLQVNFHLDFEDSNLKIQSNRDQDARLIINLKVPQSLFIRFPGWAAKDSLRIHLNEQVFPTQWVGPFLFIPKQEGPSMIELSHNLPSKIEDETIDGVTYQIHWRGDEVVGIHPNTDWLPFYESEL
jgi:hypothetical protein